MEKKIQNEEVQYSSRKWKLAILIIILATVGTFLPPLISVWLLGAEKLVLLSGAEWVSVITLVTGLYIGGNVWQKHIENRTKRHMFNPIESGVREVEEEDDDEKEA